MKTPERVKLVDDDARTLIRTALDENLLVEAAAGTGKTTELLHRIVSVLAQGRAAVHEIVAVTFTDKAAGELRLRLRTELERAYGSSRKADERRNLEEALRHLEEARINTIHGFCADLLRERPVEAATDPSFEPLPEGDARRLYAEAFRLWMQRKLEDPPEGIRRSLRRTSKDGPIARLESAGWELAQWRDFPAPWQRPELERDAEIDRLVDRLHHFAELTAAPTNPLDLFYRDTVRARRFSDDIRLLEKARPRRRGQGIARDYDGLEAEFVRMAFEWGDEYKRFRKPLAGYGAEYAKGVLRKQVQQEHAELVEAIERFARLADADLAALLHDELRGSIERYEQLKVRAGRLDFLDLLVRARDMLRHRPDVRRTLQQRIRCIFVDEFQDTDPVQVEILMLLAAADSSESDWRKVRLAPGKLFVVGDPKQAIYRFRRADVGIYQEVKTLCARQGARCLNLTTSFRAQPALQNAINAAFGPVMRADPATLQADYVPLSPYRDPYNAQPCLVALPVPRPYGSRALAAYAVEASLPDAVGAFLSWLLKESGWTVTERDGPGRRVPVEARHVCLLFRRFTQARRGDMTRDYIEALEARDIPHLLVGGKAFHTREEVETVRVALTAIEWPDDELSVFATLRGSFFAIGDDELLDYRHRFRRLHPFRLADDVPERLAPIVEALKLLQTLHRRRNDRPVAETLAELLEATRAYAGFALRTSGEQALANVLHLSEMARDYDASGGISFRGFVERLRDEAEGGEAPEAPILEENGDGVRLISVHKAKGLEFPVVILADATAKLTHPRASRYVDPARGLSAVQVAGWAPVELQTHNDEEVARDRAEGIRVAYVAATRARDLLVVPAIGDDPSEKHFEAAADWWTGPLAPAIYPRPERRRAPVAAPACPKFGGDSVLVRPPGKKLDNSNVCPGAHAFEGTTPQSTYSVVWWDPACLALDVPRKFGIPHYDLLEKIDPQIVQRDLAAYREWEAARRQAIESGSTPSLVVTTATERAHDHATDASFVGIVEIAREAERPAGPRYGALVHAVLATVALGAGPDEIRATAALHGRILGAGDAEVASAVAVVASALEHPIMLRAREALARGECRRESPLTLKAADGTLVEGVTDVAFREEGAWVVVDFKTDRELEKRLDVYRRQVALYAQAISLATGEPSSAVLMRV